LTRIREFETHFSALAKTVCATDHVMAGRKESEKGQRNIKGRGKEI
jgi:hypothetical protein